MWNFQLSLKEAYWFSSLASDARGLRVWSFVHYLLKDSGFGWFFFFFLSGSKFLIYKLQKNSVWTKDRFYSFQIPVCDFLDNSHDWTPSPKKNQVKSPKKNIFFQSPGILKLKALNAFYIFILRVLLNIYFCIIQNMWIGNFNQFQN